MSGYALWILIGGGVAAGILALALTVILGLALWRRIIFKIALRNALRRPLQSSLVVFGLMVSTAIIAAALAIGDTLNFAVREGVLTELGHTDVVVGPPDTFREGTRNEFSDEQVGMVQALLAEDSIDGVLPARTEVLSVLLERTFRAEASAELLGVDASGLEGFGELEAVSGNVDLASLGAGEAVLSAGLASGLDAEAGDELTVVDPDGERRMLTVAGIAENGGLAAGADTNRILLKIEDLSGLLGLDGGVDTILVSAAGGLEPSDEDLDSALMLVNGLFADREAERALYDTLASLPDLEEVLRQLEGLALMLPAGGATEEMREEIIGDIGALRAVLSEPGGYDDEGVATQFALLLQTDTARSVLSFLSDNAGIDIPIPARASVDGVKAEGLALADLIGLFSTIAFNFFGSFSIISGILLIVLIFVLLSASRQQEMGVARAIGMTRSDLVRAYIFEGILYSLVASAVGVVLGTLAASLIVDLFVTTTATEDAAGFAFTFRTTPQAWLLAYSIGTLFTLVTVLISSSYAGRLNIVTAIRGLPPEFVRKATISSEWVRLLGGPVRTLAVPDSGNKVWAGVMVAFAVLLALGLGAAGLLSGGGAEGEMTANPVLGAVLAVLGSVLSWLLYGIVRFYSLLIPIFRSGVLLLVLGVPLYLVQRGTIPEGAYNFLEPEGGGGAYGYFFGEPRYTLLYLSVVLTLVGACLLAYTVGSRFVERRRRNLVSGACAGVAGVGIVLLSVFRFDQLEDWLAGGETLPPDGVSDIWFFIVATLIAVAAPVVAIIMMSDLWEYLFKNLLGRVRGFSTSFQLAVAYVFSVRFRTGLTMMTFSLVIFVLILFSVLNTPADAGLSVEEVTRGVDVSAELNKPLEEGRRFEDVVAESPRLDAADFEFVGASEQLFGPQALLAGEAVAEGEERPSLDLWLLSDGQLERPPLDLAVRHPDYATDQAAWAALGSRTDVAIINAYAHEPTGGGGGPGDAGPDGFLVPAIQSGGPFPMVDIYRDPGSMEAFTVQVIGVTSLVGESGFAPIPAAYLGAAAAMPLLERPAEFRSYSIVLRDGVGAGETSRLLEGAFVEYGLDATEVRLSVEMMREAQDGFTRLFQGFMGLGLVVGTVALGVIAFRAIVERRRSIGITRAIGLRAPYVALQFVLESAMVALISVGIGIGIGILQSRQIFNAINVTGDLTLMIPWNTILVLVAIVVVASILITLGVAVQASRIKPAETLRFE